MRKTEREGDKVVGKGESGWWLRRERVRKERVEERRDEETKTEKERGGKEKGERERAGDKGRVKWCVIVLNSRQTHCLSYQSQIEALPRSHTHTPTPTPTHTHIPG